MEILELLKDGELANSGVLGVVCLALLGLVIELVRELVINYHKK
ncbi:hypothetical protein [Andreesenia angusta]|nr:hypothetical protein [Andreesenia angusta]